MRSGTHLLDFVLRVKAIFIVSLHLQMMRESPPLPGEVIEAYPIAMQEVGNTAKTSNRSSGLFLCLPVGLYHS